MRSRKVVLYLCAIPVGLIAIFVTGLFSVDLGRFKPQIESLASAQLQREFRIDGPLHVSLDLVDGLELQLSNLFLAGADWGAQPELVSLRSLVLQVDLWSALQPGPLVITNLRVDGLRVHLERDGEGRDNWSFFSSRDETGTATETETKGDEGRFELPVLPEYIHLTDSILTFENASMQHPLRLELADVKEAVAPSRDVELLLDGNIRGEAIALKVSSARVDDLVDLQNVDLSIGGNLGEIQFDGRLSVADLLLPRRPTAILKVVGPSVDYLLQLLEVGPITSGPLGLNLSVAPAPHQTYMNVKIDGVVGEFKAKAAGQFQDLRTLDEVDYQVQIDADIASLAKLQPLLQQAVPNLPLLAQVNLSGDNTVLRLDQFSVQSGVSNLTGELTVTAGDTPDIRGHFHSSRIDLNALLPAPQSKPSAAARGIKDEAKPGVRDGASGEEAPQMLIPDTAVPMSALEKFVADISIEVEELNHQVHTLRDVKLAIAVEQGGLTVERFELLTPRGGKLRSRVSLKPSPAGPELRARLIGSELSIGLAAETEEELSQLPGYGLNFVLVSQGDTVRSLAGNANGYFRLDMGRGRIAAGATRMFTNDFIIHLLDTLNPFARQDPYTKVRCGMVLAAVESGQVVGEPILIFRTDRMTITANANVDLRSEELKANFATTPRKGLGISLTSLVNPYVMVVGTLSEPILSLDSEEALVQGGAAVATAGVSILVKGIKDRFFSEKDPCGKAALEATEYQRVLGKKFADPALD